MSGLNLLRQSLVQRSFNLPLRIFILAVLGGGLAGVLGTSCVVPDPEYCANTEQCPAVATELGMTQQVCHPTRHPADDATSDSPFDAIHSTRPVTDNGSGEGSGRHDPIVARAHPSHIRVGP